MDLHQKEIQGFFSFPVDNLRASPFLLQYIQEEVRSHQQTPLVLKEILFSFSLAPDFRIKRHTRHSPLSLNARGSRIASDSACSGAEPCF